MPVQEKVIPHLLNGEGDVVALAQTGTGKTAAFGLPLLQRIDPEVKKPQALILSPTRELCLQIGSDLADFSKYMPSIKVLPVYGGSSIESQIRALRAGVQVIVATPGRLIDLINRGEVNLDDVHTVVLDEADEMLNMGFLESIDAILEHVPADRKMLMFSATMPKEIAEIAKNFMHDPVEFVAGQRNEGAKNVRHIYYMVKAHDKYLALKRVADNNPDIYGIIFCRTRKETQEVADKLIADGYNADCLHGDLSQAQRDMAMRKFRDHVTQLLVATDVAARGLDVDDLTHVINYGLPEDTAVYTHRSGRTGRAGKTGVSVAIIHSREKGRLREIEKKIGKEFEYRKVPTPEHIIEKQLYNLADRLEPFGVNVTLLVGGMKAAEKRVALAAIADGRAGLVVGTHAVLTGSVVFKNLGLAIVDEQHRFGVRQRGILAGKANNPHLLVMSATPIPRTLGLLMYGDLDISILDELPPGRKPIKTWFITGKKRRDMYGFLEKQIAAGHRFGDENGLADNIAQSHIIGQVGADIFEQILDISYADYVIGVVVIDGDSRIAVVHRERYYFAQRIAYLSRRHIGAVGHYISGVEVIELEDVVYHLFLRVLYNALFSADIDHHAYLLFGHGLLRCVRIVAQQTDETVGRQGEYFYERLGYFLEAEQYSDDLERDLFGRLHGYSLGRKLAQDKREIRGYERNDNDGEAVDNACGDSAQDRYFSDSSGEHINECLRCGCGGQEACEGNADLNG